MTQQSAYIVSIARTPIGSFNGSLANLNAIELGAKAVEAALQRSGISPEEVEEIYFGNVLSANLGQNPARQIALKANIPKSVSATTVNKVCASGLKAVEFGAKSIMLGLADVVVVGGTESMTNTPHYLPSARSGIRYGDSTIVDGIARDGLVDVYDKCAMGIFADETAEEHSITREQQDEFAINSYQRAIDATSQGLLKDEIVPVEVPQGRKLPPTIVEKDEEIGRFNPEKLKKLNAAFNTNGTVTAGNASSINDGAAALVLVSQSKLEQLKLQGNAFKIVSFADGAHSPQRFTTAPSIAIPKALTRAGLDASQIDYYEINEAFSAVALANSKILNLSQDKVNVFGGAVGIGHPLGCSGARILVTLCNVLNQKGGKIGCAAVCNGGGGASSLIVEKI